MISWLEAIWYVATPALVVCAILGVILVIVGLVEKCKQSQRSSLTHCSQITGNDKAVFGNVFDTYNKVMALLERLDVEKLNSLLSAVTIENGEVVLNVKVKLQSARLSE